MVLACMYTCIVWTTYILYMSYGHFSEAVVGLGHETTRRAASEAATSTRARHAGLVQQYTVHVRAADNRKRLVEFKKVDTLLCYAGTLQCFGDGLPKRQRGKISVKNEQAH